MTASNSKGTGRRAALAARLKLALAVLAIALCAAASAQEPADDGKVQLDFNDVELNAVIDTMARLTGKNFIYDDRVRGRVTIVSPARITVDEAYAVFESVLQVKGFTTVQAPGGAIKIIPLREAKETNVETVRGAARTPQSDRFVTRLIPLRFIDAEAITNTLKPLVSKDAMMVAYPPTNTVILTDSGTNIARILDILRDIDIETYKEELSVVKLKHADADTLADQLSQIFGAEVSSAGGAPGVAPAARARRALQPQAPGVPQPAGEGPQAHARIITDARTNSLLILASRSRTAEIKEAIARLDIAAAGGGRIHVYYLKHADAEELAATLSALLSGQPAPTAGGVVSGGAPGATALRAAVTELSSGEISVTPDAPTNALVIQSSVEGFNTLRQVIDQLDIPRPQVLVEALIMEVDISDGTDLGFSGLVRVFNKDGNFAVGSLSDSDLGAGTIPSGVQPPVTPAMLEALLKAAAAAGGIPPFVAGGNFTSGDTLIQALIRASATDTGTNVLSAPHILTLDNEEAEIKVGNNIPIITSRVESAQGVTTTPNGSLASSVNVERQDIGITLRVTPQISEGASLRLKIFQEVTGLTATQLGGGDPNQVGPSLTNRKVENSVVVADNETVVIGGLIDETNIETTTKVPFLGDIPVLGWLFKSTSDDVVKTNLLIFLTPHIIRGQAALASESIRKREEFWQSSEDSLQLSRAERKEADRLAREATAQGKPVEDYSGGNPVRKGLQAHRQRYPVEQLAALGETAERERAEALRANDEPRVPRYGVLAATFGDEGAAAATLQQLIDAGYDGVLAAEERSGTLLYQIQLGPYATAEEAEHTASAIAEAFGLAPQVTIAREKSE